MKIKTSFPFFFGNLLEHLDQALYGILAPFVAPIFFPKSDPVIALLLTFCFLPLGLLAKPFGSLFFGKIGDEKGRIQAIKISIIGMALATMLMGCIPSYSTIGFFAPMLLLIGRLMQNFFSVGETNGSVIYLMEQTSPKHRSLLSGIYDISSMMGYFCASLLVWSLSKIGSIDTFWRVPFWICGMSAFMNAFFRKAPPPSSSLPLPKLRFLLLQNRHLLFKLICISGFSYMIYHMSFTLMNGYIPLISFMTLQEITLYSSLLHILDIGLLLFFGNLAPKIGKERMMKGSILILVILGAPLFLLLQKPTFAAILFLRIFILFFGVAYAAPFHHLMIDATSERERFTLIAFAKSLGSLCFGAPTPTICLWLFSKTNWPFAPGLYLLLVGITALLSISSLKQRHYATTQ